MSHAPAPAQNISAEILISGPDEKTCEYLYRSMKTLWENPHFRHVPNASGTLDYIFKRGDYQDVSLPDLILIQYTKDDPEQLELIFDLYAAFERKKPSVVVILDDDQKPDQKNDDLQEQLRKAGTDMVLNLKEFEARRPEIAHLVIDKWFRI